MNICAYEFVIISYIIEDSYTSSRFWLYHFNRLYHIGGFE